MTDKQITSRCQNCGSTRKEHAVRKPWRCPTRLQESYWKPWTVAEYEEAQRVAAAHVTRARAKTAQAPTAATELIRDLWWFIENVTDETPDRTERFFALRERVRMSRG